MTPKLTWHHPLCKGECFACLIERTVKEAYGEVGLRYLLKHINAAPVRTKDLTDDEIATVYEQDEHHHGEFNYRFDPVSFARAVIAADREKNRG